VRTGDNPTQRRSETSVLGERNGGLLELVASRFSDAFRAPRGQDRVLVTRLVTRLVGVGLGAGFGSVGAALPSAINEHRYLR
jgi:hypothetical protein